MNNSKLQRELGRQLRDFQYEVGNQGEVIFQGSRLVLGGMYTLENVTRQSGVVCADNRVVTEGMNHIANVILGSTAKISNWFIAPFAGNVTPQANLTAATFTATTTEFTNYTETTRQGFTASAAATTGVIGNLSTRAEITIGNGAQTVIFGLGLLSASAKSATTGVLFSAARLPSSRSNLEEGDKIAMGYQLTLSEPA